MVPFYISDPIKVDRMWYTSADHLHTIAIATSCFTGRLTIQASLSNDPGEGDWFSVLLNGQPFIDYPRMSFSGETSTIFFNFKGRFTFLRVKIDKTRLLPMNAPEEVVAKYGAVDRILINI
jgi:hypothetical protein